MEYAIALAREARAHLVGVFLDEFIYRNYSVYEVVSQHSNYETMLEQLDARDKATRDQSSQRFKNACENSGILYSVHRDKDIALQELVHESMFADLVIISEFETFTKYKEKLPTRFIKDLLGHVHCPVMLVPAAFYPINKIVLLYDGKPSSIHAIKMFSYLFEGMQHIPVEVFTVREMDSESLRLPDEKLVREFMRGHFPNAFYTIEKGNIETQVIGHLQSDDTNELVVLGAYQRSESSRWFKPSMADHLMKAVTRPLFIAHSK